MLTSRPGASGFFEAALVAYTPEAKRRLLKLPNSVVEHHGIISEEAARAMAEGVAKHVRTGVGLAVTGNLGPSAMENKKVGLVYIAVSMEGITSSKGFIYDGTRQRIKQQAAEGALTYLYEAVSAWI
jgi:PncC family amidohydrolase